MRLALIVMVLALAAPAPALAQEGVPPGCQELVRNGGFEADGDWVLAVTSWPGRLVDTAAHSGQRSAVVGLLAEEANVASHSIVQQSFTLPADAVSSRLSLWLQPAGSASGDDRHYVLLQTPGGEIASILLFTILEGEGWQEQSFDLAEFAGQELILQIGVANDGVEGQAAMFVDDVSVIACAAEPAPTDTPEPTATATEAAAATATAVPTATAEPPTATPEPPTETPEPTATAAAVAATTVPTAVPAPPTATVPPFAAAETPDQPSPMLNSQVAPVLVGVLASSVVILGALALSRRGQRRRD